MAVERTLSIIKPDAVAKNVIGAIYTRFESAGLRIVAARMTCLSRDEAETSGDELERCSRRGRAHAADALPGIVSKIAHCHRHMG